MQPASPSQSVSSGESQREAELPGKKHQWTSSVAVGVVLLLATFFGCSFLKGGRAYVTAICGDAAGARGMLLVHMLQQTGTRAPIVVMVTSVSKELSTTLQLLGAELVHVPLPPDLNNSVTSCAYLRAAAWSLERFRKVVLLDANQMVVKRVDALFSYPSFSAVPDSMVPSRFQSRVMVLRPAKETFRALVHTLREINMVAEDLQPVDAVFFNKFFDGWFEAGPEHHIPYGFSAAREMVNAASWLAWVHPQLHMLTFSEPLKQEMPFHAAGKYKTSVLAYESIWWQQYESLYGRLGELGLDAASQLQLPTNYHSWGNYLACNSVSRPVADGVSVVLTVSGDGPLLERAVAFYAELSFVHRIYLRLGSIPDLNNRSAALEALQVFDFGGAAQDRVEVLPDAPAGAATGEAWEKASANDKFRPFRNLSTSFVLLASDSVQVDRQTVRLALRAVMAEPERIVGVFPFSHEWRYSPGGGEGGGRGYEWAPFRRGDWELQFVEGPDGEYSIVSTEWVMLHANYLQDYSCFAPQEAREVVAAMGGCDDVLLGFVATQASGKPPLLIGDPERQRLAPMEGVGDRVQREKIKSFCLRRLVEITGWMPLMLTSDTRGSFRADRSRRQEWVERSAPEDGGGALDSSGVHKQEQHPPPQPPLLPLFDGKGVIAQSPDEGLHFLPTAVQDTTGAEVFVYPDSSPLQHGALQSKEQVLCLKGTATCKAKDCGNRYMLVDPQAVPADAHRLLGTSMLLHNRLGWRHRLSSLYVVSNVLSGALTRGLAEPHRVLLFRQGSWEGTGSLQPWGAQLLAAGLGDSAGRPWIGEEKNATLCFQTALVSRRATPAAGERALSLRLLQVRVFAFCQTRSLSASMSAAAHAWLGSAGATCGQRRWPASTGLSFLPASARRGDSGVEARRRGAGSRRTIADGRGSEANRSSAQAWGGGSRGLEDPDRTLRGLLLGGLGEGEGEVELLEKGRVELQNLDDSMAVQETRREMLADGRGGMKLGEGRSTGEGEAEEMDTGNGGDEQESASMEEGGERVLSGAGAAGGGGRLRLRVLLLYNRGGGWGRLENGDLLEQALEDLCSADGSCTVLAHDYFGAWEPEGAALCDEALVMGAADVILVTFSGNALGSLHFVAPGTRVLLLLPFRTEELDRQGLQLWRELMSWLSMDLTMLEESGGPVCNQSADACRRLYRGLATLVDIQAASNWLGQQVQAAKVVVPHHKLHR